MVYPEPIDPTDVTEGMALTVTTTWPNGAQRIITGTITGVGTTYLTTSTGDTIDLTEAGTTLQLDAAPPGGAPPPELGTIFTDESGAAWQATGSTAALIMAGISGGRMSWAEFLDAHPTYTTMQDSAVVPLPTPVSPYPTSIGPGDVKIGMDIRVTITNATGGSRIVRGVCVWTQDNDNTDGTPDYLVVSLSTGDLFPYDPVPDGQTMAVELMQEWTADPDWPFTNAAEPAVGTVIRDSYGLAWQRISDAASDDPNPAVTPGRGRWFNVAQSISYVGLNTRPDFATATYTQPVSWFWLQLPAAPFVVQEPA